MQATPLYLRDRNRALASFAEIASLGDAQAAVCTAQPRADDDLAATLPSRPTGDLTSEIEPAQTPQMDQVLDEAADAPASANLGDGAAAPMSGGAAAGEAPAQGPAVAGAPAGGGATRRSHRGGDQESDGREGESGEAPTGEPVTSPVLLMRRPLDLRPVDAPLVMPRYLSVEPPGGKSAVPPQARGYEDEFAAVAASAERMHRGFLQDGRDSAAALVSLYRRMEDESQRTLDSSLFDLSRTLEGARLDLATAEADAIARLETQAQTARILIGAAARRSLGTVSARKAAIEQRIKLARAGAADIETQLAFYAGEVDRTGPPASQAFSSLNTDFSPAKVPNAAAEFNKFGPEMQAAENEPLEKAVKHRASDRSTAFTQATSVFASQLATAATGFQSAATEAFQPFQNYITQLGTTAPNQIATMRRNALKQVRKTVKRGIEAVKRSRRQIEQSLIERYDRSRRQIVATAERAGQAQNAGLARAGEGQLQGYRAMASAQGGTVTALHDEIARQRDQPAEQFPNYVKQASRRTDERAVSVGRGRRESMAAGAESMRRQTEARGAIGTATQSGAAGALAEQIAASARQSGISLMAQVLGLETGLRQMADPIASAIDGFPIPAEAQLKTMEDALWDKLNTARKQAHAAYNGGTPPKTDHSEAAGGQTVTPPPAGTGTNPSEFVGKSTKLAAAPATEEQIVSVTRTIAGGVVADVTKRGGDLRDQMSVWAQNPGQTLAIVRGLTRLRGQAVIRYYEESFNANLWDDIAFYMSFGNPVTGFTTRVESGEAVYNYLLGNSAAGALHEIQAATQWWNNGDQVQEAMTALSPADVQALRDIPGSGAVLDAVENDLDGADRRMLQILRNVNEANAADSVAAVRALRLDGDIEAALQTDPERGADNAFDVMERAAHAGGGTRLEGALEFGLTADYQVETPEQAEARRNRSWQETVARLGNDGRRRADGAAGGVEYLREVVSRQRTYGDAEYNYQASARPEQVRLLTNLAAHGPGAPETRAAQMMVEETRQGGGKPERVRHALHDPDLNADMANPDRPPPPDGKEETPERLQRARDREAQMYRFYDEYRNPNRQGPPPTVDEIRADLGARLRAGQTDQRQGRLLERQVVHGLTDPATAALAFEHAVEGAGTNEDLLRSQFGQMSRDQIDAAVRIYDSTHTPGLYERLGIFDHSEGYFRELSGDDRLEIQVLAMGQPRNERERAEVARMTSKVQLDNTGPAGELLAGEQHRRLQGSHQRLLELMGVGPEAMAFDSRGRLILAGERGSRRPVGHFNAEGGFVPAPGEGAMEFAMMMATNQRNAESYKQATDNIANAITTTLVVTAAVVSTVATGGAAASIWIPVLATATAGIAGMAASWAIKGGRYGYEDAGRDFGMNIVQAATAGIGAGLGIARAGGATAFRAAMRAPMISNQGFRALSLVDEALIAGASGAIGGGGTALFDDKAWDRGEWLTNIGHGMRKGFMGGFAGGVVTGGATRAIGGVAQGVGRAGGAISAFSRGRGADAARLGQLRGEAYSRAFPTTLAGRTIGGGLGGAATRAVEIDYDRRRGAYLGNRAQAMEEIADAGVQNSFQGFLEGIGERASDNSPRMKAWRDAAMSGQAPPALPPRLPAAAEPGAPEAGTPPLRADPTEDPARPVVRDAGAEEPEAPAARPSGGDEEEASARLVAANDDNDPVVARSLVDAGEAAPLAVIPPKPVRMALNPHNMLAMGPIPEASVFIHPNSKSFEAANDNYRMLTQADPSREAAIYRNADTGEYLVIQGREGHVTTIDRYGNLQIRGVKEGVPVARGPHAPEPGGRWVLEHHYHPTAPGDAPGAYLARFPSGMNGDIRVIVREAEAHGMDSRKSRIDFIDNGRTNYTTFAYDAVTKVVTIDYPDPITGARVVEKFANPKAYDDHIATLLGHSAELRAGTPALGRNAAGTSLTAGDSFSARRLGEAAMSGEAHRRAISLLESNGASPETVAAFRMEADSAETANRNVARDLGLVGEPDSMARLHLIMNDTGLDASMRQAIADTVLAATREHMIATGQLARDEPLVLLFHGAPVERTASLHESGAQLARIDTNGSGDDFGRGLYLTSQIENAEIYAAKKGVARGEVFPFVLRGRDLGTVVDVSPGGVHRAEWEAFVMRNLGKFGEAVPVRGAVIDPRDYIAGKRVFGTMDASGKRGEVFEAFLAHLAAKTGDPRVAAPDVVLGELGGPMTSGYGRGDQQAIRSQAVMDEMNRQIGFRPRDPAPQVDVDVDDGAVASRSRHDAEDADADADADSDVIEARSLVPPTKKGTPRLSASVNEVLTALEQHNLGGEAVATIRSLAKIDRDGVMAVLNAPTPDDTRAALILLKQRLVAKGVAEAEAAMLVNRMDYADAVLGPRFRIELAHRAAQAAGGYAVDPTLITPAVNRWLNESAVLRFLYTADRAQFDFLITRFRKGVGRGNKFRLERFEGYVLRAVKRKAYRQVAPMMHYHMGLFDRHGAVGRMAAADHLDPAAWPTVIHSPIPPGAIGPPVTDPAKVPLGLRVDHVSGRRGTVMKVVNGFAHVHFDGDSNKKLHRLPIVGGGLHQSHEPNTKFEDPPPIRDKKFASDRWDELDDFRTRGGYGPYARLGDNTVAMVKLNGESFFGINSTLDPANYSLPIEARRRLIERLRKEFGLKVNHTGEAEFVSHAEAEALLRAHDHFGRQLPEVVEIYVDRVTCGSCLRDLGRIARMLGVKELRIYQMAGRTNPVILR